MKDAENKFIKFLEERGALKEFEVNFRNYRKNLSHHDLRACLKLVDASSYANGAFPWEYVSEGEKWSAIDDEWQVFIKKDGAE